MNTNHDALREEQFQEWCARHDLPPHLSREAFEDAVTLSQPMPEAAAQGAEQTAWCIEHRLHELMPVEWFIGGPRNFVEFSNDPNKAMRFSRQQDAQAMLDWLRCNNKLLCVESNVEHFYKVTEHMWLSASPAAPEVAKDLTQTWEVPSLAEALATARQSFPAPEEPEADWCLLHRRHVEVLCAAAEAAKPEPALCKCGLSTDIPHSCAAQPPHPKPQAQAATLRQCANPDSAGPEPQAQGEPTAAQMKALLEGFYRCSVSSERYEFLRFWIRDWTNAKLQSHREALAQHRAALEECQQDAARFRWLTEDHPDAATRQKRNEILERIPVMSHSAASADIDAAITHANQVLEGGGV